MTTALDTTMPLNRPNFVPDTVNVIPTTTGNTIVSYPPPNMSGGVTQQQSQPKQQQQQQLPVPIPMSMNVVKSSTLVPATAVPNNGVIHSVPTSNGSSNNNPVGGANANVNPVPLPPTTGSPALIPTSVQQAPPITKSKSGKKSKSKLGNGGSVSLNQGENTGRWTAEEHRLFLEGLEKHGKGWKKIASLIKSRTVVQIRTHAQKYFQKLAKARQNGEEGDVSMEGRGGLSALSGAPGMAVAPPNQNKARRVSATEGTTGDNKRKAIGSVIASARREAKRRNPHDPSPAVAPGLAPYVLQSNYNQIPQLSNNITDHTNNPGAALEDSLFRFLTPNTREFGPMTTTTSHDISNPNVVPSNEIPPCPTNNVTSAVQPNHTNNSNTFIVLPNNNNTITKNDFQSSELSPTGVADVGSYTASGNRLLEPEAPSWYARGADVDELLNEAYALDWLADSGDLEEDYTPAVPHAATDALPPVEGENLPGLFDETNVSKSRTKLSTPNLFSSANGGNVSSGNLVDENFNVFDSALDEQAFVSALLESNENAALSVLN